MQKQKEKEMVFLTRWQKKRNGERDPTALLQLSIAKRGYSKKKEIEFDSTWPAATYNSEKFGFDVDSAAHSNEFSEAAAALEELTFQHHVQLVEEIYAKPREWILIVDVCHLNFEAQGAIGKWVGFKKKKKIKLKK